ncbi:unnamed protein product [Ectocarpus fasciculatus]
MNLPETVYYDMALQNTASTDQASVALNFSETRNNPIVPDAGKYECSIVKFTLDSYSLPSFIANIQPAPNTDPDLMQESVHLVWNPSSGSSVDSGEVHLRWVSTNLHIPVPSPPKPLQASSEYYWGNSYTHYVDLINTALQTATTDLKTAVGAALADFSAPYAEWDEIRGCVNICSPAAFCEDTVASRVEVYLNRPLYGMVTTLPATKNYAGVDGKVYRVQFRGEAGKRLYTAAIGVDDIVYCRTTQEHPTAPLHWSPVQSVVWTTSSLPIVSSHESEPLVYLNGKLIQTSVPQSSRLILTDMTPDEYGGKPSLYYVPSGEYRMIDMQGESEIRTIDLGCSWRDKRGVLTQFYLQSGASCSVKLMFRLKPKFRK